MHRSKKEKRENASLLDEAEESPEEVLRNFYSKIKSLETLKLIIETVFVISIKNYERIWNTYKYTDQELKEKEAFETEGNHVRHVVQPLAKRLKNMEIEQRKMKADLKVNQERMQANLEAKLERMEKLLLKLAEK